MRGAWLGGWTTLHIAVLERNEQLIAAIIAAKPSMIQAVDEKERPHSNTRCNGTIQKLWCNFWQSPELIDKKTDESRQTNLLHWAACDGHEAMAAQILAVRPDTLLATDDLGMTPLSYALYRGHADLAESLLAKAPQLLHSRDLNGNTLLHLAMERCPFKLVEKLWRMDPSAVHVVNTFSNTPFHLVNERHDVEELFLWQMSLDEVVSAEFWDKDGRVLREAPV